MKAVQLLKGLATSDDPAANKFMQALDDFTSNMNADEFKESRKRIKEGASKYKGRFRSIDARKIEKEFPEFYQASGL